MTVKENQNLKLTKSGTHPIKRRQTNQAPKIKNTICNSSNAEKILFATAQMLNTVSPSCSDCLHDQNPGVS